MIGATTPPVDASLTSFIPGPILATLGALIVIAGGIADVRGKWNGPVTRSKAKRDTSELDGPGADLLAMQTRMNGLASELGKLGEAYAHVKSRLDEAEQREEIRDRLAAEHRRWDVAVVNKLIDLGVTDMPDPPPLHVHPDFTPRETP